MPSTRCRHRWYLPRTVVTWLAHLQLGLRHTLDSTSTSLQKPGMQAPSLIKKVSKPVCSGAWWLS